MARTTTMHRWCCWCLLILVLVGDFTAAHYTDDSDYNDFDYYKDLPEKPAPYPAGDPLQDDFYMVSEEAEERNRRVATGRSAEDENAVRGAACAGKEADKGAPPPQGKWPTAERVYRYTKHRIPGYDYDELDFLEARKYHRCDDRSVWTHCLCQFTCREPNIVDCYTPCTSGCECREDYVYDPRANQCVYPDQCQPDADYLLY